MSTIALIGQHADTSKYPWSEPWRRDSLCSEPGSVHAHLVGLPVGHATQEGMFFVEAAALILEGLSSGAPFVIRERLYLIIAETLLRFCSFPCFRISVLTIEKDTYLVRHLAAAQRARGLDAGVQ